MQFLRRGSAALGAAALCLLLAAPAGSLHAEDGAGECRVVELDMTPSQDLQIVVWIENAAGEYMDTLYITRVTGSYGLGNRPGRWDFNSAWRWPYGRRETVFPVWAHRHGMSWPLLVFQNSDDDNLSHPLTQSSVEQFYCRPLKEGEEMWDMESCASTVYTDKGVMNPDESSLYPPRSDLSLVPSIDHPDVQQFGSMNPFDGVSRATPPGGEPFKVSWPLPDGLPEGSYTAWVEVSEEFDQNDHYDYPSPTGISWSDYGVKYWGQPSVVYQLPFEIAGGETVARVTDYVGYGDPDASDGLDGDIRPPDETISTSTPGSGASRLLLTMDDEGMYRVKLSARPTFDNTMPGELGGLQVTDVTDAKIVASFVAPGDDDTTGEVAGYEVRISVGTPITEDTFADATLSAATVAPAAPGTAQTLVIDDVLPETNYYIGIRAYDECFNYGPLSVLHVTTPEPASGTVDACFVATAAYGSLLALDVGMLRDFRDTYLRTNVPGELLVEAYYTFGPALATVVGESDTLRRAARAGLAPIVDALRDL